MQKVWTLLNRILISSAFLLPGKVHAVHGGPALEHTPNPEIQISEDTLGFQIPNFGEILTFLVRFFFVMAGLAALFYMLWGALSWVTSGGEKEAVQAARDKIIAAIVGVLLIVVVLAVIWTLERLVFNGAVCFGVSCGVSIPGLLTPV